MNKKAKLGIIIISFITILTSILYLRSSVSFTAFIDSMSFGIQTETEDCKKVDITRITIPSPLDRSSHKIDVWDQSNCRIYKGFYRELQESGHPNKPIVIKIISNLIPGTYYRFKAHRKLTSLEENSNTSVLPHSGSFIPELRADDKYQILSPEYNLGVVGKNGEINGTLTPFDYKTQTLLHVDQMSLERYRVTDQEHMTIYLEVLSKEDLNSTEKRSGFSSEFLIKSRLNKKANIKKPSERP